MTKIRAAIYDTDNVYRERFADYLMNYKTEEMELSVFSEEVYFLEALNVEKYHLLILGCGYEEILCKVRLFESPVLILTEYDTSKDDISNNDIVIDVKERFDVTNSQLVYTPKYQSMDIIMKKIQLMTETIRVQKNPIISRKLEVVGIISPIKHEMQMMFSLLYAQNAAREGRVLYINLMEFSGFSELFEEMEHDLGDFMILLRNHEWNVEALYSCIYEMEEFSYICPFTNPENVKEITKTDVKKLLEIVAKYTDYETIILDIGVGMAEYGQVLLSCDKIYCLEKKGYLFEIQTAQFLKYMEKLGDGMSVEQIETIEIPYQPKIISGGSHLLERLNWSEFGDFVRSKV